MDSNPDIITHSDLLYLVKTIQKTSATHDSEITVPSKGSISMISNCLKLASRLIDPDMADRWMDSGAREVCIDILFDLEFIWSKDLQLRVFWKEASTI